MRFVPLREFRNDSAAVLRQLKQEGTLVVTSNGKPVALVRDLNENNFVSEIAALEQSKFPRASKGLPTASPSRTDKPKGSGDISR
ncbi:MAG TPA: type II toxin-antitoxin system prevent-host-death family antitoxin [bacterium]|jgi:prevent-host-death family protein|nr:type II toxin-antitoxin system prevent-host-death family antitoxin [bacterium]